MFSYRHGFHAGNHADVLKHLVLVQLLKYMLQKDKPFWVVDTHAGGGLYDLTQGYATKKAEFEGGIGRLWDAADVPPPVADYLAQVRLLNPDAALRWYPGSPQISAQMLRAQDQLRLYELHPTESRLLQQHFAEVKRGVRVEAADGFAGLRAVLPPPPRRGLVLMDPPYEDKHDYRKVIVAIREAQQRFPTGTFAVWYPQVVRPESREFPKQLQRLAGESWLHATLTVRRPAADGLGLHGSGMFVFNPPYTLAATLRPVLPWLVAQLGQDEGAGFTLDGRNA